MAPPHLEANDSGDGALVSLVDEERAAGCHYPVLHAPPLCTTTVESTHFQKIPYLYIFTSGKPTLYIFTRGNPDNINIHVVASKFYGVNATIIQFVFVLYYCIVLYSPVETVKPPRKFYLFFNGKHTPSH